MKQKIALDTPKTKTKGKKKKPKSRNSINWRKSVTDLGGYASNFIDSILKLLPGSDISDAQQKKLKAQLRDVAKTQKALEEEADSLEARFNTADGQLQRTQDQLKELKEEAELLQEDGELNYDDESRLEDITNEIDDLEIQEYELKQQIVQLTKLLERKHAKAKSRIDERKEEVEALIELSGIDLEEISKDDANPDKLRELAREEYKSGFKAYSKWIIPKIPNDASVEQELMKIAATFKSCESNAKKIADIYGRDPLPKISILGMASLLGMPGRAFELGMTNNDVKPKTAKEEDWEAVVENFKNSADDIMRAQKDAKSFVNAMKSLEPTYTKVFTYVPKTGKAQQLVKILDLYKSAIRQLENLTDIIDEEYPSLQVVLDAVIKVCKQYLALMQKALS